FEGTLPSTFVDASETVEGLYLPERLVRSWGLIEGETLELVSPRPSLTPFGPQPRTRRLGLVGTFSSGSTESVDEQRAAIPLDAARRLFGDRLMRIEVRTQDLEAARRSAASLEAELPPGSRVRTWQDLNRPLFFALELEKTLMFCAIFLIVPIASLALVTVMALLIAAKRGEVAMLRAMGARPAMVRRAFLVLGATLALVGIAIGVGLGVTVAEILDRYELLAPPGDVYYVDHVPFVVTAHDLSLVVGAAALLALTATVWAARRAAVQPIVEALAR
ncbi:MAG: FtsX-like permease family protein, partial [Acidobacteriota bacterium]